MRTATLLPLLAIGTVATTPPDDDASVTGDSIHQRDFVYNMWTTKDLWLKGRDVSDIGNSIHQRDLVHDIWTRIKNGGSCSGCQGILMLLKAVAHLGDSAFTKTIQSLCKTSKVADEDVCHGIIGLEGPALAAAVRDISLYSKTANTFCATLVGLCEYPSVNAWPITLPSPPQPIRSRPPASSKKSLQIVHFSDIHVDNQYTVGANTQCTKPICCRAYTPGDAPGVTQNPAGPFGHHMCDSPVDLEKSMYRAMKKLAPNAEMTLFTGDIVEHTIWNTSRASNTRSIRSAMNLMDKNLKMVYGTVGNHEQSPVNLIQPNEYGSSAKWLYRLLGRYWTKWTGAETRANIERIGAYAVKHKLSSASNSSSGSGSNLRVISINTNLYYRLNFELYRNTMVADPNGQLAWLVEQLANAERAGDRVYIIGHMPLGDPDALHDPSSALGRIVNRFSDTIAAMFFGHTHIDHFELHYADGSDVDVGATAAIVDAAQRSHADARIVSYIAPSLTPTSGMPSFRVYEVDPDTWAVRDVIQYVADMDNDPAFLFPNQTMTTNSSRRAVEPQWRKLYSAREAYVARLNPDVASSSSSSSSDDTDGEDHLAELSAAHWHNITQLFETDDAVFQEYVARKSRGWQVQHCSAGDCKTTEICQLRAGRAQDNCHRPSSGLHLSRRAVQDGDDDGDDGHHHDNDDDDSNRHHRRPKAHRHRQGNNVHDDCGASPSAMTLSQLATSRDMLEKLAEMYGHFQSQH